MTFEKREKKPQISTKKTLQTIAIFGMLFLSNEIRSRESIILVNKDKVQFDLQKVSFWLTKTKYKLYKLSFLEKH